MILKAVLVLIISGLMGGSQRSIISPMNLSNLVQPVSSNTTLFLCGDVMTGRGLDQVFTNAVDPTIYEAFIKNAADYVLLAERKNGPINEPVSASYIWGDAIDVWKQMSAELKIINLETSITLHDEPWPGKGINYRMHPDNTSVLTAAGIDFCSLANNHTLDWGRKGLLETMHHLKKTEIAYGGAGINSGHARKASVIATPGGKIIILAYGVISSGIPPEWAAGDNRAGINFLADLSIQSVKQIGDQVKAVKQVGDIVIFSIHWGTNWGYYIPVAHKLFAHQLIDSAGIDLIHGHSSHHPRGIEVYKDKLILYGAGDFINDYEGIGGHEKFRADLTLMYFPELDAGTGKLVSMKMVPMQIKNFRLNHTSSSDAKWLKGIMDMQCESLGTNLIINADNTYTLHW